MLEDFKINLPERIVMHLSEKVVTLGQAAVLADEYVLTHKMVLTASSQSRTSASSVVGASCSLDPPTVPRKEEMGCFYCHQKGHIIRPDLVYAPFLSEGCVSCTGKTVDQRAFKIIHDTGAGQSIFFTDVLPWFDQTYCGSHILLCGIEASPISVPLNWVHLHSDLVSGQFCVGVVLTIAVEGVALLLEKDIAGAKVPPVLEVTAKPQSSVSDIVLVQKYPQVFPAFVLTGAQTRMEGDTVNLSDTVLELVETVDVL